MTKSNKHFRQKTKSKIADKNNTGQYLARARHWGEGTRKTTGHRTPMGSNGIRRDLKPSA